MTQTTLGRARRAPFRTGDIKMGRSSPSVGSFLKSSAHRAAFGLMIAATPWLGSAQAEVQIGADNNNVDNPLVQPEDPAQSGGGRDQSLQNGDSLLGTSSADVQIGLLGIDVLQGRRGRDVQIGGPDPGPPNNDRAFGGPGADVFLWQPGDGSDLFDGGPGVDAIVFGNITLDEASGLPFLDSDSGLPEIDATNVAGFCEVVDGADPDDAAALEDLGLDHLVRFFARGPADTFEAGTQTEDNGLRVTLHLVNVQYAVCAVRDGGAIEVFDLRVSPPALIAIDDIGNDRLRTRLQDIVL
jgi:hypothetical protein